MGTTTTHDQARADGRMAALLYFQAEAAKLVASLTEKEAEVVKLIAAGMKNAEIAEALGVGTTTVWERRASALAKLGVKANEQACVIAAKGMLV